MKRHLLFTFIMLLILSANANAATTTVTSSDTCATLSLTGPDTDPGHTYYIEASGMNNLANWYYAWFYVDGVYYNNSYSYSFFNASFRKSYGPFTGPHTFKFKVMGGVNSAHDYCWSSVELAVAVKKDLKQMAKDICTAINALSDSAFKNNPSQRKNAFCNKIDEVIKLIESAEASTDPTAKKQYYQEAINKLLTDIGDKMDSHAGGDSKDDWIIEQYQPPIYKKVQELVGELVNLL